MLMSLLLIVLLVSILSSSSSALRLNGMRSTRLIQSSMHTSLISQSRLSMFSNDGKSQIADEKKETTAETTAVVESNEDKNDGDALANVGLKFQDILTYGLIAWTIYLVGDSFRIVMFPPPPPV